MSPGALLALVRARRPLVHHLTSPVTAYLVAAATAAVGAAPVLAEEPDDAAAMAAATNALVCNLGMPRPYRLRAMEQAAARRGERAPAVLDPVGAGASAHRTELAVRLLDRGRFNVLRGNAAEIGVLAGAGGRMRGVEAVAAPRDLEAAVRALASARGLVVAATGAVDRIAAPDGRMARVRNGSPQAGRIVGAGCMATAVVGAFCAVGDDAWQATTAALACFGLACEQAAAGAAGAGSFLSRLLDALSTLEPDDLDDGARIEAAGTG